MPAAPFRPAVGAVPIPGYQLEAFLGRGGFGEVWRAVAPGGFRVALKFLPIDGEGAARELESLRLLQHVRDMHILPVFGVWRLPGCYLLVMELADSTLGDLLKQYRRQGQPGVPGDQLRRYFGQAAAGLDFLNAERHPLGPGGAPVGIQHGDVKPQNLLIVGSGVKVGDFGLLRSLRGSQSTRQTGGVTVAYASPEMFGGRISRHSDQYSLAVAWCELRGGRLPFDGDPMQLMAGHMMHEPDLSMLPEEERPALRRALSKQPEERWPSCAAFVEALGAPGAAAQPAASSSRGRTSNSGAARRDTSRRTETEPASPPPAPRRSGGLAMAAGLAATLLLTAGVVVACLWLSGPHAPATGDGGRADKDRQPRDEDATPVKDRRPKDKDSTAVDPPKPQPFTNTIGMRFVPIKAGEFVMGSLAGEEKRSADETPHLVKVTRGFYLGAHLVTQRQWEQVMGPEANRSRFKGKDDDEKKRLPVDNVSWDDCQEFCARLSRLDGRPYRLPWEAEWEYACRAGTPTPFWTGDTISTDQANFDGTHVYGKDGKKGISREQTTPVDQFPPNRWGLHDMHGNLFQWCQDGYGPYPAKEATDPRGPDKGERVLRGGSWSADARGCRSAYRDQSRPDRRGDDLGLRVATPLDPPEGR
jgi:formylglycine-generating enzyme required for sulfatase activity